jgi:hypothetical protein
MTTSEFVELTDLELKRLSSMWDDALGSLYYILFAPVGGMGFALISGFLGGKRLLGYFFTDETKEEKIESFIFISVTVTLIIIAFILYEIIQLYRDKSNPSKLISTFTITNKKSSSRKKQFLIIINKHSTYKVDEKTFNKYEIGQSFENHNLRYSKKSLKNEMPFKDAVT